MIKIDDVESKIESKCDLNMSDLGLLSDNNSDDGIFDKPMDDDVIDFLESCKEQQIQMGHKRAKTLLPSTKFLSPDKNPNDNIETNLKIPFDYHSKQNTSNQNTIKEDEDEESEEQSINRVSASESASNSKNIDGSISVQKINV